MRKFPQVKDQMDLILRGTEEVVPIDELERKLKKSSDKKTVKLNE